MHTDTIIPNDYHYHHKWKLAALYNYCHRAATILTSKNHLSNRAKKKNKPKPETTDMTKKQKTKILWKQKQQKHNTKNKQNK